MKIKEVCNNTKAVVHFKSRNIIPYFAYIYPMKRLFFIPVIILAVVPALVEGQCTFKVPNTKPRKDQYSQSSQASVDKSKKQMADQQDEFDQKKYQATVKNNKAVAQKRKTVPRYL